MIFILTAYFFILLGATSINYLQFSNLRLGYLINFNVPLVKNGIKRMVM
ncbi:MAG: hypothetical protein HOB40_02115 [Candidatus Marinimicrobia bacterium]|nr:hypothetical protein [Candidatus Neomarinimicrobiota bacterium]MBT3501667.1 hypothetical protein [Candidatus Neomarinimicrobiota bacterium]MBT3839845.1 hypothetical protein [Candidatus Neomarinimicrobiota bacterium]MBT3998433.1 hypothetical protein [Candidatus Neomarinimicrobiota bacterium]MBT4282247.1 hypothetical protein [Candidatus Neomarinimicrobiota bacterium]